MEDETYICRAIGVESSRHRGHYTEYLIMAQIEGQEGLVSLPPPDRENIDLEVAVEYDIPEVARDAFPEAELIHRITSYLYGHLQRADPKQLKAEIMAWVRKVYVHNGSDERPFLRGAVEAMPKGQGESWHVWRRKLESFVEKNIDRLKYPPIKLCEAPTLRATQIEVPEALRPIASALFVATAPRVPMATDLDAVLGYHLDWPCEAGPAPFVRFRIPVMEAGIDLATTASMAAERTEENEATLTTGIFQTSIAADDTMEMELAAISKLRSCNKDTSDFARLSRYLLDFRAEVQYYIVTETFPVLEAVADRATMADGIIPADEAGVFCTNTLSRVLANIDKPRQPLSYDKTMDALWQEFQRLHEDQKAVFSNIEWLPYAMLIVMGAAGTGKTHVCLLTVLMACLGMVVEDGDDEKVTPKPQALVCGSTHAQADDLCAKFDEVITRCRLPLQVVRLDTMDRELANAAGKGFVQEETVCDPVPTGGVCSTFDQEVSRIMDSYRENKSAKNRIHGGVYSVSEIAYAKLEAFENGVDEDDEYDEYSDIILHLDYLRKVHGDKFPRDIAEKYRLKWKQLIMMIIEDADICVTTPVAAKQLAGLDNGEHFFKPRIVWSDDVGHTTEASGLAPLAFFPDARLRILSGDPESEVMMSSVLAGEGHESTSILQRMQREGAPVCRLRTVHDGASAVA